MSPAKQSFGTHDSTTRSELRLEIDIEPASILERLFKICFETVPALQQRIHLLGEETKAILTVRLGCIERHVCSSDVVGRIAEPIICKHCSDRDRQTHFAFADTIRSLHMLVYTCAKATHVRGSIDCRLQDQELVAPKASKSVGFAH